jgi:ERF superfamily
VNLSEKLHAIQKLARKVPKNGYNEREDFHYMRIEDVIGVATRAMAKYKLLLVPTLKSSTRTMNERGGGSIVDVVVSWTLSNLDEYGLLAAQVQADVPGSGWDFNSKATAKALTDSRKSAMILLFNLKGGDDPEERGPVARDAAKDRQQQVADDKLANAAAGKSIDANVPALFYEWFPESNTSLVTGDKDLMKRNADLLKEFKLGGKPVLNAAQLEDLKIKLEERGIPFRKLVTG